MASRGTQGGARFDWLTYVAEKYDETSQALYELPSWAWWRRRKLLAHRTHWASRVADELAASLQEAKESL